MKYFFETHCKLVFNHHKENTKTSEHEATSFYLDVSENLKREMYVGEDGLPTADGVKAATVVFIQGLLANIHSAHQSGYWKDHEHMQYIIDNLQKGFVAHATVKKGNYDNDL